MRRLFRWALYLFIILVVLLVAGIFLLDRIVKEVIEHNIRSQTGLDSKIENVMVGLATPTFTIEGLTLYNNAEFGGSPMLKIPELHIEYDLNAMRAGDLHLKLIRLNISEIDAIKDKKGRLNFQEIQEKEKDAISLSGPKARVRGFTFSGIDTLNLTLGKLKISSLQSPKNTQEISFGIENQVFHNIKSEADLGGLGLLLAARQAFAGPSNSGSAAQNLLRDLTAKKP